MPTIRYQFRCLVWKLFHLHGKNDNKHMSISSTARAVPNSEASPKVAVSSNVLQPHREKKNVKDVNITKTNAQYPYQVYKHDPNNLFSETLVTTTNDTDQEHENNHITNLKY